MLGKDVHMWESAASSIGICQLATKATHKIPIITPPIDEPLAHFRSHTTDDDGAETVSATRSATSRNEIASDAILFDEKTSSPIVL